MVQLFNTLSARVLQYTKPHQVSRSVPLFSSLYRNGPNRAQEHLFLDRTQLDTHTQLAHTQLHTHTHN